MVKRLTPEQKRYICDLRALGWGWQRIADNIGCAIATAQYHAWKHGAEVPRPIWPLNPKHTNKRDSRSRYFMAEEDHKMIKWRKEGLSIAEIGRRLKRATSSINWRLMMLARREDRI